MNYGKPVASNSVTCDLVGETKLSSLLEALLAYLLNLLQFNIVPMCYTVLQEKKLVLKCLTDSDFHKNTSGFGILKKLGVFRLLDLGQC